MSYSSAGALAIGRAFPAADCRNEARHRTRARVEARGHDPLEEYSEWLAGSIGGGVFEFCPWGIGRAGSRALAARFPGRGGEGTRAWAGGGSAGARRR